MDWLAVLVAILIIVTIVVFLGVIALCLVGIALIILGFVGYFLFVPPYRFISNRLRWKRVSRGICPKCQGHTFGPINNLRCYVCGRITPQKIKNIKGRCSFCGSRLVLRNYKETIGKDGSSREIEVKLLGCPVCLGDLLLDKNEEKRLQIVNGSCQACQGQLEHLQEVERISGIVSTYGFTQCAVCLRRTRFKLIKRESDPDYVPYE